MSSLNPKPGILDITPYQGGVSDIKGVKKVVKLSSNEGALGPSTHAIAALKLCSVDAHRYPDGDATMLKAAIAQRYNIEQSKIVCGAGSDELLTLLCRGFAGNGDEVLCSEHGFAMYPIIAKSVGAQPIKAREVNNTASLENLLNMVTSRTKIVFLANPNNPTGTYVPESEIRVFREKLREDILLIIDAAYAEFVSKPDYEPGLTLVKKSNNSVMTRTFSKIHALGGLRLGWAYCPQPVADVLNRIRSPFNVSSPALQAGLASFNDEKFIAQSTQHNELWLDWTQKKLQELGLTITPSVCNFVLVCFDAFSNHDASAAYTFLKSKGIIVRSVGNYGFPNCLRISIGLKEEMEAVIRALELYLHQTNLNLDKRL